MRLDLWLVQSGGARSRQQAQELIEGGCVAINGKVVLKASQRISPDRDNVVVSENPLLDYVSRGGVKLMKAMNHLGLKVSGLQAMDVGISTGGFSDCLLQAGVSRILGVDVGHGQLSHELAKSPRLTLLEGQNIRDLSIEKVKALGFDEPFDLIVVDVSFISLEKVIPHLGSYLKVGGHLLALVKPQFEVGPSNLDSKGIVRDEKCYPEVQDRICRALSHEGLMVEEYFPSEITGADGNKEFFAFCQKQG